jgi:predicted lipoprotein with Yx(FWY)xxD motif
VTRHSRQILIVAAIVTAVAGAIAAALADVTSASSKPADLDLRTEPTPAGRMVVTDAGLTVYIYLPDQTHPSQTTCTGDCANDWPPVLATSATPKVAGIARSRVGETSRPDGTHQITLNGYPLYRFAADHLPGDVRGESVGNTWYAIDPDGNFLALAPVSFQPNGPPSPQPLQVTTSPIGQLVAAGDAQTLYTFRDDTTTSSACTPQWCVQDWPPLLVAQPPATIAGIASHLGAIRQPDGTLQLTLAGHPLYRFAGDQHPGDLRGQGIGTDWYPIAPDGTKLTTPAPTLK